MYIFLLPLVIVTLLTLPVLSRIKHFSDGKKAQRAIIGNLCTFFGIMILAVALPIGGFVSAEATAEAADVLTNAAGLGVGLGSIGCGIAVANAAPAAIGAVAEEPSSFGKAMIFVALGEGVALYGFLIAFLIIQALA